MSLERVRFSAKLIREAHLGRGHFRMVAALITLGEILVGVLCGFRGDYLSCYAMAAYLAKEHVIARFTKEDE